MTRYMNDLAIGRSPRSKFWLPMIVSVAVCVSVLYPTSALANPTDEPHDLSSPVEVIEAVVPNVGTELEALDDTETLVADVNTSSSGVEVTPEALEPEQPSVTIHAEGVSGSQETEAGITSIVTDDADSALYVQPTETGVRLMHVIGSPTSETDQSYRLTDSAGEPLQAEFNPDGSALFRDSDGMMVGTLDAPWAFDANQNMVPTHYTYEDGVLVQVVEVAPEEVAYPVVADPNWNYSMHLMIGRTTLSKIWNELHRCFNCNFPISGAPKSFPAVGAILPLTMNGVGNFKVSMNNKWYTPSRSNAGFQYLAQPGHIDGAGSTITFDIFLRPGDNNYILSVGAFVKKDFPLGNNVYWAAAHQSWSKFAGNIRYHVNAG